jgi:hypothetical protein
MICLGNETCLIPPNCNYQYYCLSEAFYQSSAESCPSTTYCTADQGCGSADGVCAYCPGDGSQCTVVDGVTSSESCSNLTACELPNGDIRYDLTAEQCVGLPGQCSGECAQPICRPYLHYYTAVCAIFNMTNSTRCNELTLGTGKIDALSTCYTFGLSQSECDALGPSYGAEFITCESLPVSMCNTRDMSYIQWYYLQCGVSDIGPCQTKESCEGVGGTCSDAMWMRTTKYETSDGNTYQNNFYNGICTVSGTIVKSIAPFCQSDRYQLLYDASGCLWDYYSCPAPVYTNTTPQLNYWSIPYTQYMNWQFHAATKEECLNDDYGRFGCRVPGSNQILKIDFNIKWMYNETDCDCLGGIPEYVYTWTPGVWQTGTPRPLTWMTPSEVTTYEWKNATSLFLLESWVVNSVEQDVISQLKSQLVCEENVITNSLNTLVCDCLAADSPRGIVIYF